MATRRGAGSARWCRQVSAPLWHQPVKTQIAGQLTLTWCCRHGVGKWRLIQKDQEFADILISRSNVDLKVSSPLMSVPGAPAAEQTLT